VLIVLGALAIALIALNPGNSGQPGTAATLPPATTASPQTGPTWRVYQDGDLEFHLQDWHCGVRKIGALLLIHRPDGQYCLVKVDVRNVGTSPRSLTVTRQFLFDGTGTEHQAYSLSRLYFPFESLWNVIQPGAEASGTLVFDIPVAASPTHLELHEGLLGDGVTIPL
jgi:hypothetical protein